MIRTPEEWTNFNPEGQGRDALIWAVKDAKADIAELLAAQAPKPTKKAKKDDAEPV